MDADRARRTRARRRTPRALEGAGVTGGLRERDWSAAERAAVITFVEIVMGCLFIATYSLALGDPVPHRIDAAVVGDPTAHTRTVDAVEEVARDHLVLRRYASVPAALHAIDQQHVAWG
jgi:hypothetical protein